MKTMKKIFALALALMLVFSLALTANAATNTVTITNAQKNETYTIYKMLNVKSQSGDKIVYEIADGWTEFFKQDDVTTYFDIKADNVVVKKDAFNDAAAATVAALAKAYVNGKDLAVMNLTVEGDTATANLADGYYLMTSTLGEKNTLVNINNASLTIREKNTPSGLPDIEKEIGDSGTGYKVGDVFTSTIKVTCDEGKTAYTVVDTMTGLELVSAAKDFEVKYNGTTINPNITINDAKDSFEVKMQFAAPTKAYDEITITYQVKVTEAGVNEITNTATIKENPTVSDEDQANNGGFTLEKKDESGAALDGAQFKLYSDVNCTTEIPLYNAGTYYRPAVGAETAVAIVSDENGAAFVNGLGAGTYYLKETAAPAGYVMDYTVHTVTIDLNATSAVKITVTNVKGEELPETGGMGTTLFYTVGGLMAVAAVVLLVSKKRMGAM